MATRLIAPVHHTVNASSSDEEIMHAINEAGKLRLSRRSRDYPEPGEANQKAWVIPRDIGWSSDMNRTLVKRLQKMVAEGLLEMRHTTRIINTAGVRFAPQQCASKGMPRFRVKIPT